MKLFLISSFCVLGCVFLFGDSARASESHVLSNPEMISGESAATMTLVEAANYCRTLSSLCEYRVDGSACSSEAYKGWHLPSADELSWFFGLSDSQEYLWTRTPFSDLDKYLIVSLSDGSWGWGGYAAGVRARCVK